MACCVYVENLKNLEIYNEYESVEREVKKLTASGVNKIIVLGHAGITKDVKIAEIEGVDVVIGGHSHTFKWTGVPSHHV